jgi:hypothetical protein
MVAEAGGFQAGTGPELGILPPGTTSRRGTVVVALSRDARIALAAIGIDSNPDSTAS